MTLHVATAAFMKGYQIGRGHEQSADVQTVLTELAHLRLNERPFAFEGAAMAWEIRDSRDGAGRRAALLERSGTTWRPLILLGAGCAWARLELGLPMDPTMLDGYGFYLGLRSGVSGLGQTTQSRDAERGRGRALWFVTGGDGLACASAIARTTDLAGELWRGIGTACAFAGDPLGHAARLPELAGRHEADLRLGADRAAALWRSLGEVPVGTTLATRAMGCGPPATGSS